MNPRLDPLEQPPTLAETVAAILRERIISGVFAPGERLVEAELARQLQVSRGPVREALAGLRAEGLAFEDPRRGSFVAALTADDVREIYELRAALESRAARLIIEHEDDAALERLSELIGELGAMAEVDDRDGFARLDARFHEELCRLSGNERLHRIFVSNAGVLGALLRLEVATQYEALDGIFTEHETLWEEIRSRDVQRAEAACNWHLEQALERVVRMRSA